MQYICTKFYLALSPYTFHNIRNLNISLTCCKTMSCKRQKEEQLKIKWTKMNCIFLNPKNYIVLMKQLGESIQKSVLGVSSKVKLGG